MQTRSGDIGDTRESVGEPSLGIDVVEATGRDHRQHDGGAVGAALRTGEGPVSASESYAAQGSFRRVVKGYGARGAAIWAGVRVVLKA